VRHNVLYSYEGDGQGDGDDSCASVYGVPFEVLASGDAHVLWREGENRTWQLDMHYEESAYA